MSDDCDKVLRRVHEFLDHELDTASSDDIRQHLSECEPCLDEFDVEQALRSLISRCCSGERAPAAFRARLVITLRQYRTM